MPFRVWMPGGAFVMLAGACVWWRAPLIEGRVQERATHTLQEHGVQNVGIRVHGRDATLTGVVDTATDERRVLALVEEVWGVRKVVNQLTRADQTSSGSSPTQRRVGTTPPPRAPEPHPALDKPRADALSRGLARLLAQRRIEFQRGSDQLSEEGRRAVDEVAKLLTRDRRFIVEIGGHNESSGSAVFDLDLSRRRAESVALALAARDVAPRRLVPLGFGASRPHASVHDGAKGQRIEFRVIGEIEP